MSSSLSEATPLLKQYKEIKSHHRDKILFFRMGDFYEMFYADAELASRVLGITLTARGDGVPLAGVPVKAAAEYLKQLVTAGHRVAICEQVEDPKKAKGIVKREVIETVTPGALLEEDWLPGGRNNFIVAVHPGDRHRPEGPAGLAAIDLSTGEFLLETVARDRLEEALGRLAPAEVVTVESLVLPFEMMRTHRELWEFDAELASEELTRRFALAALDGLGIEPEDGPAVGAAGALLRYLSELQPSGLAHLSRPAIRRPARHLWLDEMTRRNLELVEPLRAGARGVTLLEALDVTVTPMGARLLRRWLLSPLSDAAAITERLDAVDAAVRLTGARDDARAALDGVRDLERLAGRAAAGRANPRELGALRDSFRRLPRVATALGSLLPAGASALERLAAELDLLEDLTTELETALADRPPVNLADGGVIRSGFDPDLDEARSLRDGGKQYIASIQQRERDRTGIPSLKVGYNKVFGYFIEVTHTHAAKVPADYERRQTLATAERYVTPELKEYEAKVLGAEERMAAREGELFNALRSQVGAAIDRIQGTARVLAHLDVWTALADGAVRHRYVRPRVDDGFDLVLTASRHPVIERLMPRESFMPNDVRFEAASRVQLVTGPNMAGKSTILRQIGLVVVMAQIGAFVPAASAVVGVVDRLFTRVGASDNLARGQSTFMVEMSETSAILHNASPRSLVLLDEIGRGTSTYDGVAIAWAVTEHLHDRLGCKTMFATHYHELMQLPERLAHARNMNVAVRDTGEGVVFLHRLEAGGTDRSYGIHVAQLAGLPDHVVARAQDVLRTLEGEHRVLPGSPRQPTRASLPCSASNPAAARDRDRRRSRSPRPTRSATNWRRSRSMR
ncbi:MAG: DNA mismatch repair protein MutS [Gemmatimonadales bacterium]